MTQSLTSRVSACSLPAPRTASSLALLLRLPLLGPPGPPTGSARAAPLRTPSSWPGRSAFLLNISGSNLGCFSQPISSRSGRPLASANLLISATGHSDRVRTPFLQRTPDPAPALPLHSRTSFLLLPLASPAPSPLIPSSPLLSAGAIPSETLALVHCKRPPLLLSFSPLK